MARSRKSITLLLLLLGLLAASVVSAQNKNKSKNKKQKNKNEDGVVFCGEANCYEILGLQRANSTTASVIRRAFYRESKRYHPDRNSGEEAKKMFEVASQAYEVLGSKDSKAEYDEFLDYPERFYFEFDGWHRKYYFGEQESVWVVILVVLVVATLGEHFYKRSRYRDNRRLLCADVAVQDRVRLLRISRGQEKPEAVTDSRVRSRKQRRKRRADDIEITDEELLQVVHFDGICQEPTLGNLLCFRMLFWPWILVKVVYSRARWYLLFDLLHREFGMEDKIYLTRTRMDMSQQRWDSLPEEERKKAMRHQLWVDENFKSYKSGLPRKRVIRSPGDEDEYEMD